MSTQSETVVTADLGSEYMAHRVQLTQASAADDLLASVRSRQTKPSSEPGGPVAPATSPMQEEGEPGVGVGRGAAYRAAGEAVGAVAADVGKGVLETPRAVTKGARDALQSAVDMGDDLMGWIAANPAFDVTPLAPARLAKTALDAAGIEGFKTLPDIDAPESVTGNIVKGVTQFLVGMKGAGKLLKGVGVAQNLTGTAKYSAAALKGAVANFGAFDPHQLRLSNLIESFPALANPVTGYLASDPADTDAEGRFKNALEGLGLGVIADGFFKSVKLLREAARAKAVLSQGDEALAAAGQTPKELPNEAFRGLGDEAEEALVKVRPKPAPEPPPGMSPQDLAKATKAQGKPESEVFINFARIDTPQDVQRAIGALATESRKAIDAARRGTQTFEQIKLNAQQRNAWDDLVARRAGEPLNAEQSVAARQLWASSATKLTELADVASMNPSETNLFAFRKMLAVHDTIQQQVIAARTETARALASWRIPAGARAERMRDVINRLQENGGPELAREMAARVAALGKAGMVKEMGEVVAKSAYAKTRDAFLEAWINGLLSNPATHVANTLSNTSVMFLRMTERMVASKISSLLGTQGGVEAGEATAQWFGMVHGLRDAFRYSLKAARTGNTGFGMGKLETPREGAITSEAFGLSSSGWLGRGVDMVGSLWRVPGRALSVEDEFFKTLGYRMELHAQALRQATADVNAGLVANSDAALRGRVAAIIADPPTNIRMAAVDAATYQTFTNTPGHLAQQLSRATSHYPALKVIMPFTRTPANILNFTFERTPLAPLMSKFRTDVAAGGARRDLALAQMALGTSTMIAMADLAMNGQVSGRGPVDKGQRAALERTGWKPYALQLGDRWYTVNRLDPIGSLITMSADLVETFRNAQHETLDDPDAERVAVAAAIAFAGNLTNKTYLSGLADVFEALSDPQRYGEATVQRLAGSLVPAGVAAANRQADPYVHEVYSMLDAIAARTPGLSGKLPVRRNLWGEPLTYESGLGKAVDFMSPVYSKPGDAEPIDTEILRLGANVTMPGKRTSFNGVTVDLSQHPGSYSRYVELAGNAWKHPAWGVGAKDLLNQVVSGGHPLSQVYTIRSDGSEGGKDVFIRDIIRQYREGARRQLLEEFPEIRAEVEGKQTKQRELRMPVIR